MKEKNIQKPKEMRLEWDPKYLARAESLTGGPKVSPEVSLPVAEKVLRDIARRRGYAIKKRRSQLLKRHFGDGYSLIDPMRNFIILGGRTGDGCDLSLAAMASQFEDDPRNTSWQRLVIRSIKEGKVTD